MSVSGHEYEPGMESEPHFCPFCEIVKGKLDSAIVNESQNAMSIVSMEGHLLVIPKKHIEEKEIDSRHEELSDVFKLGLEVLPAVKEAFKADGVNILINLGKSAGQEISHFHIHLIPRKEGDKKIRISHMERLPMSELKSIAGQVQQFLPFSR